jgi:hypothetical protein
LALVALSPAPLVHADSSDDQFLSAVAALGITGPGDQLITAAHSACDQEIGNGRSFNFGLTSQALAAGVPYGRMTQFYVAARRVYCPDKLHSVMGAGNNFSIYNGNIIAPDGNVYLGGGVNISDSEMSSVITSASGGPITALFPGINMVRVACYSYQPPSYYQQFVSWATGLGIVVMLENHQNFNANGTSAGDSGGGRGAIFTGSMLTRESNWYAALASAFKSNPYVWFMTNNEPPGGTASATLAELATWQQATYNAIRGTGNNNIIACEAPWGGGVPVALGLDTAYGEMTPAVYAAMANVVWDLHEYGWQFTNATGQDGQNYTVTQAEIQAEQATYVAALQEITSSDGQMPVIAGESGNSTTGASIDASGQTVVDSVIASVGTSLPLKAACFWQWISDAPGDQLTNEPRAQSLTSPYGTSVAAFTGALSHRLPESPS